MTLTMRDSPDEPTAGALRVLAGLRDPVLGASGEAPPADPASVLETLAEGVVVCDIRPDGTARPTVANAAARHLLGPDPAALLAGGVAGGIRLVALDGRPMSPEELPARETVASGRPVDGYVWGVQRADGERRWVRSSSRPLRRLEGELVGVVLSLVDVTDWVEATRRLAHHAQHDPLTGLPNRATLLERLAAALVRMRAEGSRCALLFVDLDHFKHVNDSLGHGAGDAVLVALASRVRHSLRPSDVVCRLGGDELVVLAERVAAVPDAVAIAERIRAAVAQPLLVEGVPLSPTCSIGVAVGVEVDPDELLRQADTALYKAKEQGRDRCVVFEPAMQLGARHRLDTEGRVRAALRSGGVAVHYQPIVALDDGHVVAREALVRVGGDDEPVEAGDVVRVAGETDLIVDVGSAVLRQAVADAAGWPDGAALSVNVAARQLRPALVEEVRALLGAHRLEPDRLYLELTESALVGVDGPARAAVDRLAGLGVRLALDDFGTTAANLADLRRLPVAALKLDRSFTVGLGRQPDDDVVVAVVDLARTLGVVTVAKGVETAGQAARLRALGCDLAQGHWFGRPAP
ncbi:EAL domain-containing protein, partial [Acidimicrobiaceae bacterium USS-CC1]|nr:EAL domain-containing protein [Acidiferrimicrobium australe]